MIAWRNIGIYIQRYSLICQSLDCRNKHLCACEPAANVAVEMLCGLLNGKTVEEAAGLTEGRFYQSMAARLTNSAGKYWGSSNS